MLFNQIFHIRLPSFTFGEEDVRPAFLSWNIYFFHSESSALPAFSYISLTGRQVGTSLLTCQPSSTYGKQAGRSAVLFCQPSSTHDRQVGRWALFICLLSYTPGRQVGRLEFLFSSNYLVLHLVGRSASRHFSSASLLLHMVGRSSLLICQPSSTPGRQVGRLALLFSSACSLLHQVGRSAGWHFCSHLPAVFYTW